MVCPAVRGPQRPIPAPDGLPAYQEGRAAGKTGGAGVFLRQDRKKKMVDRKREKTRKLTMACFFEKRSGKVTQCFLGRDCLLFQRAFVKMKKDRKDREGGEMP